MKRIFFLTGILLLFLSKRSTGQQVQGIKIGDKIPNVSMGKFLNEPHRKMRVGDFRSKLLIIDFWNTRCKVCLSAMPESEKLQKQFSGRVQFVYVTHNSQQEINQLFATLKVKKPDVPFIVEDSLFNRFFPHAGDPLHVWIDSNGYVRAITDFFNTNEETIGQYLSGKNLTLPRRWDWGMDINYPLLSEQNAGLLNCADGYALWLKGAGNNTMGNGCRVEKESLTGKINFLQVTNADLFRFYGIAYRNDLFPMSLNFLDIPYLSRIVLEVKDSTAFFQPTENSKMQAWLDNYVFCYEIRLASGSTATVYDKLKQDLADRFPYQAKIEKRRTKCIVLSDLSIDLQRNAVSQDSTLPQKIIYNKDRSLTVQNLPISEFIKALTIGDPYNPLPFYSETSFKGNVQMHLNARLNQIELLNKELNQYGFKISKEVREINMLVITDRK